MTSPNELTTVTLRVVSPCEHGVAHDILEVKEGDAFSTPACRDSRGVPRIHVATAAKYPTTKRRR